MTDVARPLRVLVVDDDEVDRMAVVRALAGHHPPIETTEADTMEGAFARLAEGGFDCVVADYDLPDGTGADVLVRVQRLRRPVPVIMLTGQGDEHLAARLMRDGAADYLAKSRMEPGDLHRTVRYVTAVAEARRQAAATAEFHELLASTIESFGRSLDLDDTLDAALRVFVPGLADSATLEVDADPDEPIVRSLESDENGLAEEDDAASVADTLRLAVPGAGGELGVLELRRGSQRDPFSATDRMIAGSLADRAGAALVNALLYRDARRAVQARDDVIAIVSHDLRNPVGTVLAAASLLRDPDLDLDEGARRRQLDVIRRAGETMNRLIRDLLDVSRIEAGRFTVVREPTDVADLLSDIAEMMDGLARDQGVTLDVQPPTGSTSVELDGDRVQQVFSNLIGNALRATPPGGTVTVGAAPVSGGLRFWVSDTGPGIPEDLVAHLFDRFWQGERASREGAGLGLPIAKGIVEAHGSTLEVDTAPGQGTTFHFVLGPAEGEGAEV